MATQNDLIVKLIQTRLSGTSRVRDSDGSEIQYKSDAEMARALGWAQSLMQPQIRQIRFISTKGLWR